MEIKEQITEKEFWRLLLIDIRALRAKFKEIKKTVKAPHAIK